MIIPDRSLKGHTFTANETRLASELEVFKRDLVTVEGKKENNARLSIENLEILDEHTSKY